MVPPQEDLLFVNKSTEKLCLQMKHHEKTGEEFVGHIFNDHDATNVQFIAAGFKGDRALGDGLKDYDLVAEPPPGDQAALTEKARQWVKLLDGHWKDAPDCGCVMPEITLQVQHRSAINPNHTTYRAGNVGFSGDAKFEVTLTAVHDAAGRIWYQGTRSFVRTLQPYFAAQGCQGTASEAEEWLWSAEVDTASLKMKLQWSFTTSEETGKAVCITRGHRSEMALEPSLFGGQSLGPMVMPLDSGATKEVTVIEENKTAQEWLTVKVVAVP
ncbi:MAG TPA: hypothetical protein VMY76_17570 [Gemmatimonadales bacterium]|nr:hypothetical protein [Gemmatimonadales bacterium]